ARSTSSGSPPQKIVSVPFCAPSLPPDTGASTRATPCSASRAAKSRVADGAIVEQSMTSWPSRAPSAAPLGPNRTASTSGVSDTQTTTASVAVATAAGLSARVTPRSSSSGPRPGLRFQAVTVKPARARLPAIAAPIVPSPRNPIRSSAILASLLPSPRIMHRREAGRMPVVAQVAALIAAAIHVWFFVLESVLFSRPGVAARFGLRTAEQIAAVRPMAFNQGFYNLFLAVGIAAGVAQIAGGAEVAGREGFEPSEQVAPLNGLANRRTRPLCDLSVARRATCYHARPSRPTLWQGRWGGPRGGRRRCQGADDDRPRGEPPPDDQGPDRGLQRRRDGPADGADRPRRVRPGLAGLVYPRRVADPIDPR